MSLFQSVTKAHAVDCVIDETVTFIVSPGQMGLAIGKSGEHIKKVSQMLKKPVDLAEYADTFEKFAFKLALPAIPKEIQKKDGKIIVYTDSRNRYLLKGNNGKILKRMKMFLERHYGPITKVEVKS